MCTHHRDSVESDEGIEKQDCRHQTWGWISRVEVFFVICLICQSAFCYYNRCWKQSAYSKKSLIYTYDLRRSWKIHDWLALLIWAYGNISCWRHWTEQIDHFMARKWERERGGDWDLPLFFGGALLMRERLPTRPHLFKDSPLPNGTMLGDISFPCGPLGLLGSKG